MSRSPSRDPSYSAAARAVGIALRTGHLGAMAALLGGQRVAPGDPSLQTWQIATVLTGLALLMSEMSHSRHWIYQARGATAIAHAGVLAFVPLAGGKAWMVLAAALVIGSVGSHLPRGLRKWSFRHRRVVDD